MLARGDAAKIFQPGDHASTFGGNPLACAATLATLEEIIEGDVVEYTNAVGEILYNKLLELWGKYDFIKDVRGKGLLLGMELEIEGKKIVDGCLEKGLLINCVGGNVLRFIPPLIVSSTEVKQAVGIIDEVMARLKKN
jgi:acetylornithine/succinyldiaminopimelate/putrescine aminotransferase